MTPKSFAWLACALVVVCSLSGCSKKSSPTAPVDPNAALYGTWSGTLTETSPGPTVNQFRMSIVLAKGSVAFYLEGSQFPAVIVSQQDPTVVFTANNGSNTVEYTGTRAGATMNGAGTWPSGLVSDVWALTKASPEMRPLAVTRQPDPLFGDKLGSPAHSK